MPERVGRKDKARLLFNNIAKHLDWPKIRPKSNGQAAAPAPVSASPRGAGRWGLTDSFIVPTVSRTRAIEVPTTNEPTGQPTYLWYGAPIPIICDLLEQGRNVRPGAVSRDRIRLTNRGIQ